MTITYFEIIFRQVLALLGNLDPLIQLSHVSVQVRSRCIKVEVDQERKSRRRTDKNLGRLLTDCFHQLKLTSVRRSRFFGETFFTQLTCLWEDFSLKRATIIFSCFHCAVVDCNLCPLDHG